MSFLRRYSESQATPSVFPTYLGKSLPFRNKSRQSSTDSTCSNRSNISASSASTVSSNPFSRSPTPLPIQHDDVLPPMGKFISGHSSHIHCAKCSTDLCLTSQIISKGFTGRHGRAYLVQGSPSGSAMHVHAPVLPNTFLGKAVPRSLVTGQHTVSDISCSICGTLLGWKYVEASEESQKYKVGKFILETKKTRIGVSWEGNHDDDTEGEYDVIVPLTPHETKKLVDGRRGVGGGGADLDALEFDSQDEDECEDLFAGVWSPQLAAKRRQRKTERMGKKGLKTSYSINRSQDSFV